MLHSASCKNDELRELEDFVKIPGLQAEGENYSKGTPSQTKSETQPTIAKIISKDPTKPEDISKSKESPDLPRL